jgi:hypothetical protein
MRRHDDVTSNSEKPVLDNLHENTTQSQKQGPALPSYSHDLVLVDGTPFERRWLPDDNNDLRTRVTYIPVYYRFCLHIGWNGME